MSVSERAGRRGNGPDLATFAQFERRLVGQRTREALAAKRAAAGRGRLAAERTAGMSLGAIAAGLNDEGVARAQGGARWWPATLRAVLASAQAAVDERP